MAISFDTYSRQLLIVTGADAV